MKGSQAPTRWLTLLAVTTALALMLTGCGGGKSNSNDSKSEASKPTVENQYKDKYEPEVTITTAWGIDPELRFKNGESMENNVATK
jgi:putative aldouronate transport system substrate-binding protein